jgi:hypothetical protein
MYLLYHFIVYGVVEGIMWRGSGGVCMPFVVGKDCKGGWNLVRPDGLFSLIAQVLTISQCEGRCDFYVCALSC